MMELEKIAKAPCLGFLLLLHLIELGLACTLDLAWVYWLHKRKFRVLGEGKIRTDLRAI
jgi:hypothetical protein